MFLEYNILVNSCHFISYFHERENSRTGENITSTVSRCQMTRKRKIIEAPSCKTILDPSRNFERCSTFLPSDLCAIFGLENDDLASAAVNRAELQFSRFS